MAPRFTESFCQVHPLGFYRKGLNLFCFSDELYSWGGQGHKLPVAPSARAVVLTVHCDTASKGRLAEVDLRVLTLKHTC